jgi:hypothetical protein
VADGYDRSSTFRDLVDRIESLRGIVYIEPQVQISRGLNAELLHVVSGSRDSPILRVVVHYRLKGDRAISSIAHELQHVVEALSSGLVLDGASLDRFFESIAAETWSRLGPSETEAARFVDARVTAELVARPSKRKREE